jgi:hypothetical protein
MLIDRRYSILIAAFAWLIALSCLSVTAHAEVGEVILWNKLGNTTELLNSEVGPGAMLTSYKVSDWQQAKFAPGKFGNGLFVNHDINEGWSNDGGNFFAFDLTQMAFNPRQGTIELWFNFQYGSGTHNHAYFFKTADFLTNHFPDDHYGADIGFTGGWNGWDYGSYGKRYLLHIADYKGAASTIFTPDFSVAPGGELDFNTGTVTHFAFVWDINGIDASVDTMRLYVNGVQRAAGQSAFPTTGRMDRYLYVGTIPNQDPWDHNYNAVKGVTDNLVIRNYAKTDFSDRFEENPGVSCEGVTPKLSALVTKKSGPQHARQWTLTLTDNSHCPAENTQIDDLTLTQTFGAACSPVVMLPSPFPLPMGDITSRGTASTTVTVDFSGCPNNARFRVTIPYSANDGASSGSITLNNQFR